MKTTRRLVLFGLFILVNGLFIPFVEAHGTGHRVIRNAGTITVESFYSDQEPMAYAKTMIYGPSDRKVEFQNGSRSPRLRDPEGHGQRCDHLRDEDSLKGAQTLVHERFDRNRNPALFY